MEPSPLAAGDAVRERLWAGAVPVVFSLDASEVTTLHTPRPFYAMVPRMSFLVSQTRVAIEYFRDAAPPVAAGSGGIWFTTADGHPLPWHVPFGLLRDLHGRNAELPWRITVRFLGFPSDKLLPCENERSVETHFMHSLKQATYLRSGSTKAIMALPEAQQNQIWTSVVKNDYASYRQAMTDVVPLDTDPAALKHLPLRVYLDDSPAIQMPITPLQNGEEKTLGDVLSYLLPDLFPADAVEDSKWQLLVHGVAVPPHVSVVALYWHFAYADGFLYVSVVPSDAPSPATAS